MKFRQGTQNTTPVCMLWYQGDQTGKTKAHLGYSHIRFENAKIPAIITIISYVLPKRLTIYESTGVYGITYQADKDAEKLDDVCVGH